MPEEYNRSILKLVIAQICQMIGWHSINSTPLEFLVDVMQEYLLRISKVTKQYAEVLGRTEANLDDLGLAFQQMHVLIPELSEYVRNVDSVPCIVPVPKFPVSRENHLNFLKPGSQEVVTRSVHVHEHLPAMYPNTEDVSAIDQTEPPRNCETDSGACNASPTEATITTPPNQLLQAVFKRPGGLLPSEHTSLTKRSKIVEEGRPLREIHSVIMTTSGFLSPAREGKLPEPRTPLSHQARPESPPPSSYPMVPPELKSEKKAKKPVKKEFDDRKLDKENKKKNRVKELFEPDVISSDVKTKKLVNPKEIIKPPPPPPPTPKTGCGKSHSGSPGSSSRATSPQYVAHKDKDSSTKAVKTPQSRIKPEKMQQVLPINTPSQEKEDNVDKLPSEPDKQKLNIFKKISKPREEKSADCPESVKYKERNLRDGSPGIIADEISDKSVQRPDVNIKRDEKKVPKTPEVRLDEGGESINTASSSPDVYIFGDMSPPGTPSTPKTPELEVPLLVDLKKKKKERNIRKKEPRCKSPKRGVNTKKMKNAVDVQESQLSDRPKTPQAVETELHKEPNNPATLPFPFFPPFPSAPGLIPHPIGHPMFPRYPLAVGRGIPGTHPAMPNLPMPPRFLTSNILPDDCIPPKAKITEFERTPILSKEEFMPIEPEPVKFSKPIVEKTTKYVKTEKEIVHQPSTSAITQNDAIPPAACATNNVPAPILPRIAASNEKLDKSDRNIKKSKDHKKDRKDKLKKKKDKKEKHKIKDKSKGKKGKLTKLKDKKDKKIKRKDKDKDNKTAEAVPKITLKLGPPSPRPITPDSIAMKKITIKPLVKKFEEEKKREPSPELAKISALVTRPPKQKVTKLKADIVPKKNDETIDKENGKSIFAAHPITADQSNRQVWICPACGNQDDGSPMIGCDDCDAWYHWVCVGVQVPPADHEDWYCRLCIAKKEELHQDKKKKKRKKKIKTAA